jgi:hypothetical protein
VSGWGWAGLALILIGLIEFVLFRFVLAERPSIKSHRGLLMVNAAFNVVVGVVMLIVGLR